MPLNFFRPGATPDPADDLDKGTNLEESVKHIINSEPIEEVYLRRSPENLRYRSEDVRVLFDDLELTERSDRALTVMSDIDARLRFMEPIATQFTFNLSSTGAAGASDRDLVIGPLVSTSDLGPDLPVFAKYYFDNGAGEFEILSSLKVCEGAHNIYVRIFKGSAHPGTANVTVEGALSGPPANPLEGPIIINIDIDTGDLTTVTNIVAALNALEAPGMDLDGVTVSTVTAGGATVVTVERDPVRIYEGDTGSIGGIDNELHLLPWAQIDIFFGAEYLLEGDCLVVDWASAKARQASTGTVILVAADDLSIVSATPRAGVDTRNTADAQGIVPICKVLDGKLYFLNGKVFEVDTPDYLVPSRESVVYEEHMLALAPADQHDISVILNHNLVHVPGDYATLQAAINALAGATGGTIILNTDSGPIDVPAISSHITVIGTSKDIEIAGDATPTPAITFTAATSYNISFKNLLITMPTNAGLLILNDQATPTLPPTARGIHFDDCRFTRVANGTGALIVSTQGMKFTNCYFNPDNAIAASSGAIFEMASTAAGGEVWGDLIVQNCRMENSTRIFATGVGAAPDYRSLIFENNTVVDCGDDADITDVGAAYSTYQQLFEPLGVIIHNVSIVGNSFTMTDPKNETRAARLGDFITCAGNISNNYIDICPFKDIASPPLTLLPVASGAAVLTVDNAGASKYYAAVRVSNNNIVMGGWSATAIGLLDYTCAINNNIVNWGWHNDAATPTDEYAAIYVQGSNARVIGNHIAGGDFDPLAVPGAFPYNYISTISNDVTIANNTIQVTSKGSLIINVEGSHCTIVGNIIEDVFTNSNTGIFITGAGSLFIAVSGNTLYDVYNGITVSAGESVSICGNTILAFSVGIDITANCVVSGNVIDSADNIIGIINSGANNSITGNVISGGATSIGINLVAAAGGNAVTGNGLVGVNTAIIAGAVTEGVNHDAGAGYSLKYNNPGL